MATAEAKKNGESFVDSFTQYAHATTHAIGQVDRKVAALVASGGILLGISIAPPVAAPGLVNAGLGGVIFAFRTKNDKITLAKFTTEAAVNFTTGVAIGEAAKYGHIKFAKTIADATCQSFAHGVIGGVASTIGKLFGAMAKGIFTKDLQKFQEQCHPKELLCHTAAGIMAGMTHFFSVEQISNITPEFLRKICDVAEDSWVYIAKETTIGAVGGAFGGFIYNTVANAVKIIRNDSLVVLYTGEPKDKDVPEGKIYFYLSSQRLYFKVRVSEDKVVKVRIPIVGTKFEDRLVKIKKALSSQEKKGLSKKQMDLIYQIAAEKGFPKVDIVTNLRQALENGFLTGAVLGFTKATIIEPAEKKAEQEEAERKQLEKERQANIEAAEVDLETSQADYDKAVTFRGYSELDLNNKGQEIVTIAVDSGGSWVDTICKNLDDLGIPSSAYRANFVQVANGPNAESNLVGKVREALWDWHTNQSANAVHSTLENLERSKAHLEDLKSGSPTHEHMPKVQEPAPFTLARTGDSKELATQAKDYAKNQGFSGSFGVEAEFAAASLSGVWSGPEFDYYYNSITRLFENNTGLGGLTQYGFLHWAIDQVKGVKNHMSQYEYYMPGFTEQLVNDVKGGGIMVGVSTDGANLTGLVGQTNGPLAPVVSIPLGSQPRNQAPSASPAGDGDNFPSVAPMLSTVFASPSTFNMTEGAAQPSDTGVSQQSGNVAAMLSPALDPNRGGNQPIVVRPLGPLTNGTVQTQKFTVEGDFPVLGEFFSSLTQPTLPGTTPPERQKYIVEFYKPEDGSNSLDVRIASQTANTQSSEFYSDHAESLVGGVRELAQSLNSVPGLQGLGGYLKSALGKLDFTLNFSKRLNEPEYRGESFGDRFMFALDAEVAAGAVQFAGGLAGGAAGSLTGPAAPACVPIGRAIGVAVVTPLANKIGDHVQKKSLEKRKAHYGATSKSS